MWKHESCIVDENRRERREAVTNADAGENKFIKNKTDTFSHVYVDMEQKINFGREGSVLLNIYPG